MKEFLQEPSVAEFYKSVMSHRRPEVQRLVIKLLQGEFKQASDLEANILKVAEILRAKTITSADTDKKELS